MEGLARLPSMARVGNSRVVIWPIHQVPLWNIAHLLCLAIPGFLSRDIFTEWQVFLIVGKATQLIDY